MLIDSHCHLDYLDDSMDAVREKAAALGVSRFLTIAVTESHWPTLLDLGQARDIDVSLGVHPCDVKDVHLGWQERLLEQAKSPCVVAIGETGLDHFHEQPNKAQQQAFIDHIDIAADLQKPLVIHMRDAKELTLQILKEHAKGRIRGVMHCFTEDLDTAMRAIDLGFMISFSGIVTFNNAKDLQSVAKQVPIEHMLIETDAPYLAPMPYRGKPNHPGYVRYVAEKIADLKGISFDEVAQKTTQNYHSLFLDR